MLSDLFTLNNHTVTQLVTLKSIPRAMRSVAMSTQISPFRNFATISSRWRAQEDIGVRGHKGECGEHMVICENTDGVVVCE